MLKVLLGLGDEENTVIDEKFGDSVVEEEDH
jgi:hypothetical protein